MGISKGRHHMIKLSFQETQYICLTLYSGYTYRGGLSETAATMLANHKALVWPALIVHVFFVPQRLARKSFIYTGAHLRITVAAVALRVPVIKKGDAAAHATRQWETRQ